MTSESKAQSISDFLEEDPEIGSQKYFVLSYVLPTDQTSNPIIKVRGAYATTQECEKRIKRLQVIDHTFNMFIAQVGVWGRLLRPEQLTDLKEIDVDYNHSTMNGIAKGYAENLETAKEDFNKRKEIMKRRAIEEGTKEFQEYTGFLDKEFFTRNEDNKYKTPSSHNITFNDFAEEFVTDREKYLNSINYIRSCESEEYHLWKESQSPETKETLLKNCKEILDVYLKQTPA
jgi:hypothetical protein